MFKDVDFRTCIVSLELHLWTPVSDT